MWCTSMNIKNIRNTFFKILFILVAIEVTFRAEKILLNGLASFKDRNDFEIWGGSTLFFVYPQIKDKILSSNNKIKIEGKFKGTFSTADALELVKKTKSSTFPKKIFLMAGLNENEPLEKDQEITTGFLSLDFLIRKIYPTYESIPTFSKLNNIELSNFFRFHIKKYIEDGSNDTYFKIYQIIDFFKREETSLIYHKVLDSVYENPKHIIKIDFNDITKNSKKDILRKFLLYSFNTNGKEEIKSAPLSGLFRFIINGPVDLAKDTLEEVSILLKKATLQCKKTNCEEFYNQNKGFYPDLDLYIASIFVNEVNSSKFILNPKPSLSTLYSLILMDMLIKIVELQEDYFIPDDSPLYYLKKVSVKPYLRIIQGEYSYKNSGEVFKNNLKEINEILAKVNTSLILIQPPGHDSEIVRRAAAELNLEVIQNDPSFIESINKDGFFKYFSDFLIYESGHLNNKGKLIYSDYLSNQLLKKIDLN